MSFDQSFPHAVGAVPASAAFDYFITRYLPLPAKITTTSYVVVYIPILPIAKRLYTNLSNSVYPSIG